MNCKNIIKLLLSGIALVQASSFLVQRHYNVITIGTVGKSDIKLLDDSATSRILEGTIHTTNTLIGNDMNAIGQGLAKALNIDGGSISVVKRSQQRSAQELQGLSRAFATASYQRLSKKAHEARAFATGVAAQLHASSQKVKRTAKEEQLAVTEHEQAVTHLKNTTVILNAAVATKNKACKDAEAAVLKLAKLQNDAQGKLVAAEILLKARAEDAVGAIVDEQRLLHANNQAQAADRIAALEENQAKDAMYDAEAVAANAVAKAAKEAADCAAQQAADAKAAAEAKQKSNLAAAIEANNKASQSKEEAEEAAKQAVIAHAELLKAEEEEEGADWALLNATAKQKRRQDKANAALAEAQRLQADANRASASRKRMEVLKGVADVKLAQSLAKEAPLKLESAEEQTEAQAAVKTAAELDAEAKGGGNEFAAAAEQQKEADRQAQVAKDLIATAQSVNDQAEAYHGSDGSDINGSGGNAAAIAQAAATADAASAAANTAAATADAAAETAKAATADAAAVAAAQGIGAEATTTTTEAVGPRTADGCSERVVITGAEDVQRDFMGVFFRSKDPSHAKHRNRILYENAHGKTLYFWAASGNWLIDNSDSISDGRSVLYSKSDTACPSDAVGWGTWDGAAWSTTKYQVQVAEAAVDMCAEAITISGAEATLPSFMGTYKMTQDIAGAEHRGRAAYKNEEGREGVLHFEHDTGNWMISKSGDATQALNEGKGYIYASTSMECPSSVKAWTIWDETKGTEGQYVSSAVTIVPTSLASSSSSSEYSRGEAPSETASLLSSSSAMIPGNPVTQTGNQLKPIKKADTSAEQSSMDVENEILLDFTIRLPKDSSISEFIKLTFPSPTDASDKKRRFLKKLEDAEKEEFEKRHGLATIGQETIGLIHGEEPLKFASLELFCEPGACEFETLKIES